MRRPALTPTALLRLRCLVWVDSTSCSSDDAEDPYFMTAVSRLGRPVPLPLISLALRRSRPLVRRQMAGMLPNDLLTKRGSSPAPRGLLTSFLQTRSLDSSSQTGAPPRRPPPRSALARTTVSKAVP